MPAGSQSTADSVRHCQRTFKRYLELRKGDARQIIVQKAKSFAIEAYKATKAVAPTPGKIRQDVTALGWRVKRRPGAWPLKKGEKRGSGGPLRRMQAAQIRRRVRAIGSVASGFLPAITGLGGKANTKDAGNFKKPKGSLQVSGAGIAVVNSTPGIVAVEKKRKIVRTALNAIDKDMQIYINRKSEETARKLKS